tara:strand:- start:51 stop:1280 length:1230 start_codon:yes stop_codon:yes gene_type:complete
VKILLLNQTFYPDVAATAQHLTELAIELRKRGHEVSVLTSRRAYDSPDKLYAPYELWKGIKIRRLVGTGLGKNAKWKRAVDFASFGIKCALRLIFSPRYDAVIALTSPPLVAALGALVCRINGGKLFYWVMDLNPDEAVAAGWLKKTGRLTHLLEEVSRYSLRHSHRIITLDRFMRDLILKKGIDPETVKVIPPWAHDDAVQFDPEGRDKFRERHGLNGKFVVMYSGNHSPCHPLTNLIDAARCMQADDSVRFCLVGGGSEHRKIQAIVGSENLTNVICLPYQPLNELSGSLSAADLHVVVMGEAFVGTIHPCKIYNALTVQAPVLCVGPAECHLADILGGSNDPHWGHVGHGEVDKTIAQIRRIQKLNSRGVAFSELAKRFSAGAVMPELIEAIESREDDSAADSQND